MVVVPDQETYANTVEEHVVLDVIARNTATGMALLALPGAPVPD